MGKHTKSVHKLVDYGFDTCKHCHYWLHKYLKDRPKTDERLPVHYLVDTLRSKTRVYLDTHGYDGFQLYSTDYGGDQPEQLEIVVKNAISYFFMPHLIYANVFCTLMEDGQANVRVYFLCNYDRAGYLTQQWLDPLNFSVRLFDEGLRIKKLSKGGTNILRVNLENIPLVGEDLRAYNRKISAGRFLDLEE